MHSTIPRAHHKPSEFQNCMKLDVIGGGCARLEKCLASFSSSPDVTCRPFSQLHDAAFSFQSVYYNAKEGQWYPCFRYVCAPLVRINSCLFNSAVPITWRNLYEIVLEDRARHLYFDLEEKRPVGASLYKHDEDCWKKVLKLQQLVRQAFR